MRWNQWATVQLTLRLGLGSNRPITGACFLPPTKKFSKHLNKKILIFLIHKWTFTLKTIINEKTIKNNTISGTINVINKGYIKTTIPFEEKGFKVYVDNKLVKNELVDLTFLGFEIDSGKHEIKIIYNAPYFDLGKTVSIISLCILISLLIIKKKQLSNNL